MLRILDVASRCRCAGRILGGLFSALLLLSVPAYALDLTGLNWQDLTPGSLSPFQKVEASSSQMDSVLTFTLQPSSGYSNTWQGTALVNSSIFDLNNGTILNANWNGLSALNSTGTGTVAISIVVTDQTGNPNGTATMYTQNATSNPPDPSTNTTITGVDLGSSQFNQPTLQVIVTFTFSNFSQPVPSPSAPTSFTLDFHN
jgi:hypothetical protein